VKPHQREKDEHLERLWYMKEKGQSSLVSLQSAMAEGFDARLVDDLLAEGYVQFSHDRQHIKLTDAGEEQARKIIRAHRLGERLLYDLFGEEFEAGACEFEHIVSEEIVDAICILLGHPRECPHGMLIPAGDCCRRSACTVHNLVIPLTELEVNKPAKVAYINYQGEQRLQRLDGLQIRPGATVKLRQRYPCYVIECEGAHVAMDTEIAANIQVWLRGRQAKLQEDQTPEPEGASSSRWTRLLRFGLGR
jgi:DtxR family Mn-dependent transcriptional regulator